MKDIEMIVFNADESMTEREIANKLVWIVQQEVIQTNGGNLYLPLLPGEIFSQHRQPLCLLYGDGRFVVNADYRDYLRAACQFAQEGVMVEIRDY